MRREEAIREFWKQVNEGKIKEEWADVVRVGNEYQIDPLSKITWRGYGFKNVPLGITKEHPEGTNLKGGVR